MKIEYRSYVLGGKLVDPAAMPGSEPIYTTCVPVSDLIFVPHETGDLVALWALVMCWRDAMRAVEAYFPDFRYVDRLLSGTESRQFTYRSNFRELNWWEGRLPVLIEMELAVNRGEFVGFAVDLAPGMAGVSALDWFVQRYRCRPANIADNSDQPREAAGDVDMLSLNSGDTPLQLSEQERRSIEAMRYYERTNFDFLYRAGQQIEPDPVEAEKPKTEPDSAGKAPKTADKEAPEVKYQTLDEIDQFLSIDVERVAAPDGFRDEDRRGLKRFRDYVAQAAHAVGPLTSRWLEVNDAVLGRRLFAFHALFVAASFPNAEAARRREEELKAAHERAQREAKENAKGGSRIGALE